MIQSEFKERKKDKKKIIYREFIKLLKIFTVLNRHLNNFP